MRKLGTVISAGLVLATGMGAPASAAAAPWQVVPTPAVAGTHYSVLAGVSCTAPSFCMAAGDYQVGSGNTYQALVEEWNGSRWAVVPVPDPGPVTWYSSANGAAHAGLNAVSCTPRNWCSAVGYSVNKQGQESVLDETWDGRSWAVTLMPNGPGSSTDSLNAVSCASATSCTAVGSFEATAGYRTLVESWDGTKWTVIPSPNEAPRNLDNALWGVSRPSPSSCVAVGEEGSGPAGGLFGATLVESWDNARWSVVANPAKGKRSAFSAVSCLLGGVCTAVGNYQPDERTTEALAERS
ncbi:MAG TPA: hypothetical protein VME46_11750 [Acidimicrobiales bacterium]|nr:hypothetical protein [Acidimicrobiales bacterium]